MKQPPKPMIVIIICVCVILSGCGKKGDPIVPVIPRPLPVQELSASVDNEGITLSWKPPIEYNTEKPLELKDIKSFVIHRRTEAPMTKGWEFTTTNEGWSAVGKTEPIKHHKGVLRTASMQARLFVRSQDELWIAAEQNRYIRLKLWTNNAQQGYIGFITNDDTNWDIDSNLEFYPAVHTSYLTYQHAFSNVKLKAFPITPSSFNTAQEYVIDMSTVPTWKGVIKQIGILLRNDQPDLVETELGLDRVEFVTALAQQASPYHTPPWLFLEDSEGWTSLQAEENLQGAYNGVLYAQGTEPLMLFSAPGQTIQISPSLQAQIRMQVTAGDAAYLWLRKSEEEVFPDVRNIPEFSSFSSSSDLIRIPLTKTAGFHVYTVNIGEFLTAAAKIASEAAAKTASKAAAKTASKTTSEAAPAKTVSEAVTAKTAPEAAPAKTVSEAATVKTAPEAATAKPISGTILQVGLLFPQVESLKKRHVLVDFLDFFSSEQKTTQKTTRWFQSRLPIPAQIERQLQTQRKAQNPEFFIPYSQLPAEKKLLSDTSVKLAEISPKDPEPATLKDGTFFLKDSGNFIVEEEKEKEKEKEEILAPLDYESRYTYQVDILTRNKQTSEQLSTVTVEFFKIPQNPSRLQATPGDETVTLTWERPVLTVDGYKIRQLSGYAIFRSLQAGEFPPTPLTRIPANTMSFTDTNLTNGVTYYYAIQSVASTTSDIRNPELSEAIAAIPMDNIAPKAPKDVVGVYIDQEVRLYWNQEQPGDFGGFHVYRSEQEDRGYSRLTKSPLLTASYQDASVEPRKRYYYRITAIDDEIHPNESERSEIAIVDTFPLD